MLRRSFHTPERIDRWLEAKLDAVIGTLIRAYRASPFHPHLSRPLARSLATYQRLRGAKPTIVDTGRFRIHVDPSDFLESNILYTGTWEPDTVRALEQLIRPGDTAIDVGAQIGFVTLTLASLVGPSGNVYALEASDWAYDRLQQNLELNSMPWIRADRYAVGELSKAAETLSLPRGYRLDGTVTATEQTVEMIALDDYVERAGIEQVAFVKSDTDGMEPFVLRGAERTLREHHPTLLFEVHPDCLGKVGWTPSQLFAWLDKFGYRFYGEDDLTTPMEPREAADRIPPGKSLNVVARADTPHGAAAS